MVELFRSPEAGGSTPEQDSASQRGEEAALRIKGVVAIQRDCDMNQHVNNVWFLSWMIGTVPEQFKRSQ